MPLETTIRVHCSAKRRRCTAEASVALTRAEAELALAGWTVVGMTFAPTPLTITKPCAHCAGTGFTKETT